MWHTHTQKNKVVAQIIQISPGLMLPSPPQLRKNMFLRNELETFDNAQKGPRKADALQ